MYLALVALTKPLCEGSVVVEQGQHHWETACLMGPSTIALDPSQLTKALFILCATCVQCVLESIEIDVCLMGYIWRLYLHLVGYLDLQYYSLDAKLQSGAGHR